MTINIADKAKKYIDELVANVIISICKTPMESCARARFILKNGDQVTLVVDFRSVNLTIRCTGYPFTPTSKFLQKIKPDTTCSGNLIICKVITKYHSIRRTNTKQSWSYPGENTSSTIYPLD